MNDTAAAVRPREAAGGGRRLADRSIVQLTLVRYREFWREPEAVFWVFIFPILLAAGLGIAFRNRPPEVIRIGVSDPALARALQADQGISVQVMDRSAGEEALRLGKITLFTARRPDGGVTFRFDDTNPEARNARILADRAVQRAAGVRDLVPVSADVVREPGNRYIDFLVPGLLGMNLMGSGIWGLGFAIVDARRRKLLKRLVASPMSRAEYLLSFLISRLSMLLIEVSVLVGFGVFIFSVPLRGSLWELALLCFLASLCFSALALLIASRAQTIEAASGLMNLVMLPMWVFSGVFFSPDRFPAILQPFIQALPLTAVISAFRGNMLQGEPLSGLAAQIAIMIAWLILCFFTALKLFRWR